VKEEFRSMDEEVTKIGELWLSKQEEKMIEYVQIFKKITKDSGYEGNILIEEVKRSLNEVVRRRLMKSKQLPRIIEKYYKIAMAIDRN